jgi:putative flippase GtrA
MVKSLFVTASAGSGKTFRLTQEVRRHIERDTEFVVAATFTRAAAAEMEKRILEAIERGVANLLGYAAGMVTSFMLNKTWTFEADGSTLRQFRRFLVLNLAGLLLSTVLIFIFVDRLGGPYIFVWIGTTCLVMVVNFVGNKFWTFSDSDSRKPIS